VTKRICTVAAEFETPLVKSFVDQSIEFFDNFTIGIFKLFTKPNSVFLNTLNPFMSERITERASIVDIFTYSFIIQTVGVDHLNFDRDLLGSHRRELFFSHSTENLCADEINRSFADRSCFFYLLKEFKGNSRNWPIFYLKELKVLDRQFLEVIYQL